MVRSIGKVCPGTAYTIMTVRALLQCPVWTPQQQQPQGAACAAPTMPEPGPPPPCPSRRASPPCHCFLLLPAAVPCPSSAQASLGLAVRCSSGLVVSVLGKEAAVHALPHHGVLHRLQEGKEGGPWHGNIQGWFRRRVSAEPGAELFCCKAPVQLKCCLSSSSRALAYYMATALTRRPPALPTAPAAFGDARALHVRTHAHALPHAYACTHARTRART